MMKYAVLLLAVLTLVAAGCKSKPAYVPITERQAQTGGTTEESRIGSDADKRGSIEEEELLRRRERERRLAEEAMKKSPLADVLFDFDSYSLKTDYLPLIKSIGDWMKQNQSVKLVIEGHCDERGSTEYNLALGQKRADAVKDYLVRLGVQASRLRTVSYGKEMPADPGHTEEAWIRNRRVHFATE